MSSVRSTVCLLALCLIGCGSGGSGSAPVSQTGGTPPTTPTPPTPPTPPPPTPPAPPPPPANPPPGAAGSVTLSTHLLVDQFGYRNNDPKVAVIRNPRVG